MAASVGIPPKDVQEIRVKFGAGIAGLVAERAVSLLGRTRANETFISVPVVTASGVEGVLCLTERLGGRHYTGPDLASTGIMANHIATLIEYRRDVMVDPVSGLPNRRAFEEALEREISRAERTGRRFSFVYIDVDGLKRVNDSLGHEAGDRLLRDVGRALRSATRQYDFSARIGGDEFGLLLAETDAGEDLVIGRLLARIGTEGVSSLSLGIARYPDDGKTPATLRETADQRMYQYKRGHGPSGSPTSRPAEEQ